MSLTTAVWPFIFLGAASLYWPRLPVLSISVLGTGYLLALIVGLLEWPFLIPLALLLAAAYAVAPERTRPSRIAGHILFVAVALLLGFHLLPGFNNPRPFGPAPLTPDAVPFSFYMNLDKPLAGYWILLVWPAMYLRRGTWSWAHGLAIGLATAAVCLGLGVALGKQAFAPKWPGFLWLWALNSLLLVSLIEEALFRGYLQEALSRRLVDHPYGEALSIGIAAALFGAVHVVGGLAYVVVTGLAGVGYGLAYRKGWPGGGGPGTHHPEYAAPHAVHVPDAGDLSQPERSMVLGPCAHPSPSSIRPDLVRADDEARAGSAGSATATTPSRAADTG